MDMTFVLYRANSIDRKFKRLSDRNGAVLHTTGELLIHRVTANTVEEGREVARTAQLRHDQAEWDAGRREQLQVRPESSGMYGISMTRAGNPAIKRFDSRL